MSSVESQYLFRILNLLEEDLPEFTFQLRKDGQVVFSTGSLVENAGHSQPFLDHELFISKAPDQITPRERIAIKSSERLAKLLVPRIQAPRQDGERKQRPGEIGSVPLKTLLGAFLEILKLLESRSILLDNYERILQLNQQVLLARDLQGVLQVVMDMARDFCGGGGSSLLLVDAATGEMYFNVISGEKQNQLSEIRIPAGKGIAGGVVLNAKPEIIHDVKKDPRAFHGVDEELKQTTRDMIVAPIIARGQVIGVIEVVNSIHEFGFLNEDLEFLVNISAHTSLLIENARSKEDLIKTNRELDRKVTQIRALNEIGLVLAASLEPEVLHKNLVRTVQRLLKLRHGSILIPDYVDKTLRVSHRLEFDDDGFREIQDRSVLREAGDILLWLKENAEALSFRRSLQETGIVRRFYDANAEAFAGFEPELWIPVYESGEQRVLFVLSLSDSLLGEAQWSQDRSFIQGLMTETRSAFRNVQSYQNEVQAREKENHVRRVFQKYVPARVVQEVLSSEESPDPREQIVSVLFADIWGFTRLAERIQPALLLELLNEFFEEMVAVVNTNGGIVDKFMGDSLMALFGVPDPDPAGAGAALKSAYEMQQALARLNADRRASSRPEFRMAIGLHHGPAVTGNIGSSQRTDYTAVGDTVNLAARLERLNRHYDSDVLLTGPAAEAAEHHGLALREIDLLRVRGRMTPTRLFQMAIDEEHARLWQETAEDWNTAVARYRAGSFGEAQDRFRVLGERLAGDPLIEIYRDRCDHYFHEPPENDWDGVFKVDV